MSGNGSEATTIGGANAGYSSPTLMGRTRILVGHVHNMSCVIPSGQAGVTLTTTAAPWTLGAFGVVIPADAVAADFDLHWINIEDMSANGTFELVLYAGADAAEVEIARVRAVREVNKASHAGMLTITPLIPANTQVKGKVMSSTGVADTMTISVGYHTY